MQMFVIFNQRFNFGVSFVDILRIAGERHPAERTNAPTEQRANIGRDETWKIERVFNAHFFRHLTNIIAVVKSRDAHLFKRQHCANVIGHGAFRRLDDLLRLGFGLALIFFPLPAERQVAVQRIVRAGLVGDHIRAYAAFDQLRQDLRRVTAQRHGYRAPFGGIFFDAGKRVIKGGGLFVDVTGTQTKIDAALLAFNVQRTGAGERRR